MKTIKVGLIGFGTVGVGLARILKENRSLIEERSGKSIELKAIADKDIKSPRLVKVDPKILTTDVNQLIDDPDIGVIVELVGGCEEAREYILRAIGKGKHIVTANKALLAIHGREIFSAAQKKGVDVRFEASVCGGIPIIKIVREGLAANRILSILGIVNGTCNYILSRMSKEGMDYDGALKEAKEEGYAEADPSFDVKGIDSAHKLAILGTLAFGISIPLDSIYTEGITNITPEDIQYAGEFGYRIKLLAIAKEVKEEIEVRVHPALIKSDHLLASVNGPFNACYVCGDAVGETMYYGQGAGQMPTGSGVAADLIDLARDGGSSRFSLLPEEGKKAKLKRMEEIECRYYFRFSVIDRPGVLAGISGILGEKKISIASVIQKGRREEDIVPIVMMTHEAREQNVREALREIDNLSVVRSKTFSLRVE